MSGLQCWDCYAARTFGGLEACAKHATPEQRAAAEKRLSEIDLSRNPLIAATKKRRYEP